MKRFKIYFAVFLIAGLCYTQSGCFGPFRLTNQVYEWNSNLGSKFTNNVVFWAFLIIPVYEVSLFIDGVVLNTIEYWSGSNPVSMNESERDIKIVESKNRKYKIVASKNKFHVKQLKGPNQGETVDIIFDQEKGTCMLKINNELTKILEYIETQDGSSINIYKSGGEVISLNTEDMEKEQITAALY